MRVIAINRSDGGVSIMRIIDDAALIQGEVDKWQESFTEATAVGFQEIQETDIPTDRTNREAWTWE